MLGGSLRRTAAAGAVAALLFVTLGAWSPVSATTSGTMLLTASTRLTDDHVGNIVIQTSNVTLDCAGHTVSGPGVAEFPAGITIWDAGGVTVRNCAVTGFVHGVYSSNSPGLRLEHETIVDNSDHGVYLLEDPGAAIVGSRIDRNGAYGVVFQRSTGGVMDGNVAHDNVWAGFALVEDCTGSTLANNISERNGDGFHLDQPADGLVVEGNTVRDSVNYGFVVYAGTGSRFTRNTVTGGGAPGFLFMSGTKLLAEQNAASDSSWAGFYVEATTDSRFVGNSANGNGNDEIPGVGFLFVEASHRNLIQGNTAAANVGCGFCISGSNEERVLGNTATANLEAGFSLDDSGWGEFSGNTAQANLGDGFFVANSTEDRFFANTAAGNPNKNGFVFMKSSYLQIEKNVEQGSPWAGFAILGTSNSTLTGNSASESSAGIQLEGWDGECACRNSLQGNRANGNVGGNGFSIGPGANTNMLSTNIANANNQGFLLSGPSATDNLLTGNLANDNAAYGFVVEGGPSGNTFSKNAAHGNGIYDAVQADDAGPNTWLENRFGSTWGF